MRSSLAAPILYLLVFVLTHPPSPATAQNGSVLGSIVDAADGAPLARVVVKVEGTRLRAVTDAEGAFRIDDVPAGERAVRVERSGYAKLTEPVLVHDGWTTGVEFSLVPIAVLLDALRVHAGGTPIAPAARTNRRNEARPDASSRSAVETVSAQLPGVLVTRHSGQVGRGQRVLIRGPSSISLSNTPIVYVDGIRVQAEMTGFRNEKYFSLDFINPETIDRIEVLRGPAASAQFGAEATSGVILVYTKRGG
jgi:TonB-dependent SusC/RagA subfamily outer membrane receptor